MEENLFRVGGVYRDKTGRVLRITREVGSGGAPFFKRSMAVAVSAICADGNEYETGWRRLADGKYHGNHPAVDLIPGELHQVDGQWVPVEEKTTKSIAALLREQIDAATKQADLHAKSTFNSKHAEMLRKDAEGFAAAKPFVAPAIPQKQVQGPHAPIDGLTRCNDLGVRVLGSRG